MTHLSCSQFSWSPFSSQLVPLCLLYFKWLSEFHQGGFSGLWTPSQSLHFWIEFLFLTREGWGLPWSEWSISHCGFIRFLSNTECFESPTSSLALFPVSIWLKVLTLQQSNWEMEPHQSLQPRAFITEELLTCKTFIWQREGERTLRSDLSQWFL